MRTSRRLAASPAWRVPVAAGAAVATVLVCVVLAGCASGGAGAGVPTSGTGGPSRPVAPSPSPGGSLAPGGTGSAAPVPTSTMIAPLPSSPRLPSPSVTVDAYGDATVVLAAGQYAGPHVDLAAGRTLTVVVRAATPAMDGRASVDGSSAVLVPVGGSLAAGFTFRAVGPGQAVALVMVGPHCEPGQLCPAYAAMAARVAVTVT